MLKTDFLVIKYLNLWQSTSKNMKRNANNIKYKHGINNTRNYKQSPDK